MGPLVFYPLPIHQTPQHHGYAKHTHTGNFGKSVLLYWVFTVAFRVNHAAYNTNRSFTAYRLLKPWAILATCCPFSRKSLVRVSILHTHTHTHTHTHIFKFSCAVCWEFWHTTSVKTQCFHILLHTRSVIQYFSSTLYTVCFMWQSWQGIYLIKLLATYFPWNIFWTSIASEHTVLQKTFVTYTEVLCVRHNS